MNKYCDFLKKIGEEDVEFVKRDDLKNLVKNSLIHLLTHSISET